VDAASARQAIHALYDTGFFRDIRLLREGGTLVVELEEKPVVAEIAFEGMEQLKEDRVRKAFKGIGLEERKMFSRAALSRASLEIERQYNGQGFYGARVETQVERTGSEGVAVTFLIEEGKPAKIADIALVGNQAFEEGTLKEEFQLSDSAAFAFMRGSDQYARQRLMGDLESLRSFYLDRGYMRFQINSSQVHLTPDRQHVFLSINIEEGRQYRVASISITGDTIVPKAELRKLVKLESGDLFSRSRVRSSVEAMTRRVGDEGFAFANIIPRPSVNEQDRTVDLELHVQPGQRIKVRRLNIQGNNRTMDRVIRREFRQFEGARYQTSKIQRSKERVNRLGYFEEVNLETPAVTGSNEQVDLDLSVKERPTGQFNMGVGYSDVEGVMFTSSVQQRNLFGRGQRVSLQADLGGVNQNLNFSFTEPYFTVNGVSAGVDVFFSQRDTDRLTLTRYTQDNAGAAVRLGFPLTEYWRDTVRLEGERTDTRGGALGRAAYNDAFLGVNRHVRLRNVLKYDSRDSTIFPQSGWLNRLSAEASVPPGDTRYLRLGLESRVYVPLWADLTWSVGGDFGRLTGYGGESVPFYEHFYLGGPYSVRGFDTYSLGPTDSNGNPLGGVTKVQANTELLFPMPGSSSQNMRGALFSDAGWVYGQGEAIDPEELRVSVGLGFRWFSPMGPLRFDYAWPVVRESDDRIQRFQFTIGTQM
jgi:outer membrane protein insertion porin family